MNKKISELPITETITGDEIVVLNQEGVTKTASVNNLKTYKSYVALLNYNDLSNPNVLENTLGEDIIWTGIDTYQINGNTDNPIFTENKTIGFCYGGTDDDASYFIGFLVKRITDNEIQILDPSVNQLGSINIRLEIRVYN